MLSKGQNLGIFLGSFGALLGGLLWIIITGIALKSIIFIIAPVLLVIFHIPKKYLLNSTCTLQQ